MINEDRRQIGDAAMRILLAMMPDLPDIDVEAAAKDALAAAKVLYQEVQ